MKDELAVALINSVREMNVSLVSISNRLTALEALYNKGSVGGELKDIRAAIVAIKLKMK